ncbi:MAG: hypothetical protein WCK86_15775 [Planctomycetia bacterium]
MTKVARTVSPTQCLPATIQEVANIRKFRGSGFGRLRDQDSREQLERRRAGPENWSAT